jgi:hypothetical protein
MARKPNYSFERNNRAKAKAAKREAKRQAKLLKKGGAAAEESDDASPAEPERSEDANENRSDGAIPTEGT